MGTGLEMTARTGAERKAKRSFDVAFLTGNESVEPKRPLVLGEEARTSSPLQSSDSNSLSPEPAIVVGNGGMGVFGTFGSSAFSKVPSTEMRPGCNPRFSVASEKSMAQWNVPLLTVVHPLIKPMYYPPSSSPTPAAVPMDDVSRQFNIPSAPIQIIINF